jgi:hypothetical protein
MHSSKHSRVPKHARVFQKCVKKACELQKYVLVSLKNMVMALKKLCSIV